MRIATVINGSFAAYLVCAGTLLLEAQPPINQNQVDSPVYPIDSIPRQLFFRGTALKLRVSDVTGSTFSINAVPKPVSPPSIDPTGLLAFSPAPGDSGNFTLTITSNHPDHTSTTKQVIVSAFTNLAPEYVLVSQVRKRPGDVDKQYITVTETEDPVHRAFNNQPERKLVNVVISGKTVVFDKNGDDNGLMTRFDGRQDIETFSIYAETAIFRSTLTLPETNVNILARSLRFEDVRGQTGAAIVTTPNALTTIPGTGQNGATGLPAGSVTIGVGTFSAPPGNSPRFVLTGGKGQDAGSGKAGEAGTSLQCAQNIVLADDTCIVHVHQFAGATSFGPDNTWPGDGADATAPGAPGAGGPGGDFTANLDGLEAFVRTPPGQPGDRAQHVDGGTAGHPQHALSIETVGNHFLIGPGGPCPPPQFNIPCTVPVPQFGTVRVSRVESTHDSKPGKGADPPTAPAAAVSAGKPQMAGGPDAWLHPFMLRAVLNHAEDAYLAGDLDYAQSVLDDYVNVVEAHLSAWDANAAQREQANQALLAQAALVPCVVSFVDGLDQGPNGARRQRLCPSGNDAETRRIQAQIDRGNDDHNSLVQLRLEMGTIALRLGSNLDYFGNPAGWVPQLSFAATLRSYADEVKTDIPILYLAYYVQQSSADHDRHIASLQATVDKLQGDVKQASDDFNSAQSAIPRLEVQAAGVQNDITLFQEEVVNRKNDLMARAEQIVTERNNVPFWKQALGVLSAAAAACPIGQPVVGSIGKGLGILEQAGDQGIIDTAQQLGNLAGDFGKEKIKESVDKYHAQIALMDPSKAKDAESYVKGLVPLAQGLAKEYQAVSSSLQTHKASSGEVQKEAAQLESDDPNLADLAQHLSSLNSDKQRFDNQLTENMTAISSLSSTIASDWRSIDAANRAKSSAAGAVDHEAVQQVEAFGRRTRDRLLRFQYYLAKAYEYRFLEPYPGELNLNNLLDSLVALTSQSHDQAFHLLTEDQFRILARVYDESVQEFVHAAVNYIQTHPKPQQASFPYELSEDQRATLNRDGKLNLNLGQAIPHFVGEENRRLRSITVASATAALPADNSQPQAIRISFDHGGTTTLRRNKQSYLFDHRRDPRDQPFRWAGTLDGSSWNQDQIASEYIGLLKTLLNLPADNTNYDELFTYPGLESLVSVTRQGGDTQELKSLKLRIDYEYDQPAESEFPLDVITPDFASPAELKPVIEVDARDNSGRTLGQGSFTRYYPQDVVVTLTAPAQFGTRSFVAWHVTGRGVVDSPKLTVNMTRALTVQLEYTR
jgi:hypothetical protein